MAVEPRMLQFINQEGKAEISEAFFVFCEQFDKLEKETDREFVALQLKRSYPEYFGSVW